VRPIRLRRFAFRFLAVAAGGVLLFGCGEPNEASSPTPSEVSAQQAEDHAAALRGVDWMVRNADALPAGWVHPFLSRIARLVDDPIRQQALRAALARDAQSSRHTRVPDAITSQDLLASTRLTPILVELARRRDVGLSIAAPLARLQALINVNEDILIDQLPSTQKVTINHLFDELDLRWSLNLETLIVDAQRRSTLEPLPSLAKNYQYLYTLTHLVLASSNYFRNALDSQALMFTLPIFDAALVELLRKPSDNFSLDLQSEILMCYQLLDAPDRAAGQATRAFLRARQNPDGSWAAPGKVNRRSTHVTTSAIFGLIRYPAHLRMRSEP
jgi:hypothetical protein